MVSRQPDSLVGVDAVLAQQLIVAVTAAPLGRVPIVAGGAQRKDILQPQTGQAEAAGEVELAALRTLERTAFRQALGTDRVRTRQHLRQSSEVAIEARRAGQEAGADPERPQRATELTQRRKQVCVHR